MRRQVRVPNVLAPAAAALAVGALLVALMAIAAPPADAARRCGVPQSRAVYETPDVQVRSSNGRAVACVRATGRDLVIGPDDASDWTYVRRVIDGRWLLTNTVEVGSAEEYGDKTVALTDLGSGRSTTVVTVAGAKLRALVAAFPGGLVVGRDSGATVQLVEGGRRTLAPGPIDTVGAVGSRVYHGRDGMISSVDIGPVASPAIAARPAPRAQRIGRCVPRRGAELVRLDDTLVITRASGALYACSRRIGRQRLVAAASAVFGDLVYDVVLWMRQGTAGTLDVRTGLRTELPLAGDAVVADGILVAAGSASLASRDGALAPDTLATGLVRDLAIGESHEIGDAPQNPSAAVFWLAADGTPGTAVPVG